MWDFLEYAIALEGVKILEPVLCNVVVIIKNKQIGTQDGIRFFRLDFFKKRIGLAAKLFDRLEYFNVEI